MKQTRLKGNARRRASKRAGIARRICLSMPPRLRAHYVTELAPIIHVYQGKKVWRRCFEKAVDFFATLFAVAQFAGGQS